MTRYESVMTVVIMVAVALGILMAALTLTMPDGLEHSRADQLQDGGR